MSKVERGEVSKDKLGSIDHDEHSPDRHEEKA